MIFQIQVSIEQLEQQPGLRKSKLKHTEKLKEVFILQKTMKQKTKSLQALRYFNSK